jgi:Tol biopolymer transport system component
MATKDFLSATKPLARSRALLLVASVALAVLVACAVAAVAALEPAKAAFPGTNGKIAFLSDRYKTHMGDFDIFAVNPDGSEETNLTADMGIRSATNAAWSADGRRIAFGASTFMVTHMVSDLWVMNADGSGETQLTDGSLIWEEDPSWFPGGNRIAYSGAPVDPPADPWPGQFDLYALRLGSDGGVAETVRLTKTTNYSETDPAVSPDGATIAFVRDGDVYVKGAERLGTTNRQKRLTFGPRGGYAPDWSPDGRRIAFERHLPRADGSTNSEIFLMDADGTDKSRITRHPAYDSDPAFSPDGEQIAFSSYRDNPDPDVPNSDIWKMGADGSDPTRVTDAILHDVGPDWQPLP